MSDKPIQLTAVMFKTIMFLLNQREKTDREEAQYFGESPISKALGHKSNYALEALSKRGIIIKKANKEGLMAGSTSGRPPKVIYTLSPDFTRDDMARSEIVNYSIPTSKKKVSKRKKRILTPKTKTTAATCPYKGRRYQDISTDIITKERRIGHHYLPGKQQNYTAGGVVGEMA